MAGSARLGVQAGTLTHMPTVNADLEWAIEDVKRRLPAYTLFRQYDEGDHRLLFATEKFLNAFGSLFQEFADNLCEDVVDGITDRLQIIGWASNDKALNDLADEVWTLNQGESRSGAVHRNGFREGDGFTIAQVDKNGRARTYRQQPTQMAVRYSTEAPDEMDLAAKVWKSGSRYRANLYYPDGTIKKYATKGTGADGGMPQAAAFKPLAEGDPGLRDDESWVTEGQGEGMPVFHYPNGELSDYGKSILRGVIPLQDALNKAVADMLVTMEGHAAPLRWGTGIEVERDPVTNQEIDPFKRANLPGSILRTGSKDAAFGEFSPSAMEGFLDVQDSFRIEIARKGYLPPYAVSPRSASAQAPSGVSLLVAEGRTIKLAKDRQRDWGTEHKREMAYLLNLELGTADRVTANDLELEWTPPETRDELALLETLILKKELGVPDRVLLLELGYDSDEVDEWLEDQEAADEGQMAALSVLQGGRGPVAPGAAQTLNGALGLPGGPVPPAGGQTALAGQ